jgi:serine/threonine-protein kinase RsbW
MSSGVRKSIFAGCYENLAKIAEFIRQSSFEAGFDNRTIYQVETAVDEACSNIIEHGYGGEGIGDIECACEVDAERLTITLKDHGQPFTPQELPEPDINLPLEKRTDHGLGLFFIRKWMDEVYFDFSPASGNTLTLIKYKEKKIDLKNQAGFRS